ncbi:alginate O-acetyltransferase AlgX-related protein [Actinokineospora sp. NPDC004072]
MDSPELPAVHEAWLPREHSLHRPRHGGRQTLALLSALVFFATPTVLWIGGMRPGEIENRKLAEFPTPADGWGMFTGLPGWATDHLSFRSGAVHTVDWVSRTFFGESANFDRGTTGPLPSEPGPQGQDDDGPGSTEWPDQQYPGYLRVLEGNEDWLYFGYDVVAKCEPAQPLVDTIRQLNEIRDAVERSGRTFVLVVPPDKSTMVPQFLPRDYPGKDCAEAETERFWREVTLLAGAMDLRPLLRAAADRRGRPLYYREDSHWTHDGGLEMVRALAERLEPGVTRDWQVTANAEPLVFAADLPPLLGRTGENASPTYQVRPDGDADRTEFRTWDLRKPVRTAEMPSNGMITAPTVVLGDSFALGAAPYLPAAFSDVTQLFYSTARPDPGLVARTVADHEVVVLEIVERNLAGGIPSVLDQTFIDTLAAELAKRPIR